MRDYPAGLERPRSDAAEAALIRDLASDRLGLWLPPDPLPTKLQDMKNSSS